MQIKITLFLICVYIGLAVAPTVKASQIDAYQHALDPILEEFTKALAQGNAEEAFGLMQMLLPTYRAVGIERIIQNLIMQKKIKVTEEMQALFEQVDALSQKQDFVNRSHQGTLQQRNEAALMHLPQSEQITPEQFESRMKQLEQGTPQLPYEKELTANTYTLLPQAVDTHGMTDKQKIFYKEHMDAIDTSDYAQEKVKVHLDEIEKQCGLAGLLQIKESLHYGLADFCFNEALYERYRLFMDKLNTRISTLIPAAESHKRKITDGQLEFLCEDGKNVVVMRALFEQYSHTIRDMLEDIDPTKCALPLPNLDSNTLGIIIKLLDNVKVHLSLQQQVAVVQALKYLGINAKFAAAIPVYKRIFCLDLQQPHPLHGTLPQAR